MDGRAPAARLTVPDEPAGRAVGHGGPQPVDLAPLDDLIAVVDRLRSPRGCPWYAQLTHPSLLPYAIEEVHEVVEAVETDDRDGLREELGDLLLQVVLHARLAQEHPEAPFDLDDVATGAAAKLRRRNPHVFGSDPTGGAAGGERAAEVLDVATVHRRYLRLKEAEKRRESVVDGIPPTLPALARARTVLDRVHRGGLADVVGAVADGAAGPAVDGVSGAADHDVSGAADHDVSGAADHDVPGPRPSSAGTSGDLGDRLLALVAEAGPGVDAEAALRGALRRLESRVRTAEQGRRTVHHAEGT